MYKLYICILVACAAGAASLDYDTADQPKVAQRGLLKRGLLAKGKQTTTTTTTAPAPQEEAQYDEEDYPAEGEPVQSEATSEVPSSTEGKKLVGSGVRPFRSNTDLLESLKRRRAQAAEAKHQGQVQQSTAALAEPGSEAAAAAPVKTSSFSGKKRFSASSPPRSESNNEDSPAPAKPTRNRFSRPSSKSFQPEPEAEDQANDAAQTRNARTFSRRGGN